MDHRLKHIIQIANPYINTGDIEFIEKAFIVAQNSLSESDFKDTLEITEIAISELGLGGKAIVSILLFKPFVNNAITEVSILQNYSAKIISIISGLIRVQKIDTTKSKIHSENFIKLILSQADDVRIILILLAHKIFALRNILRNTEEEKKFLCNELATLHAPIAHRFGLYAIKQEMEEMSMKYLHNDIYKAIAKQLAEKKTIRDAYIKDFIKPLNLALKNKGFTFEIKGRPKSIHSIWSKLQKNNASIDHIYDLFAIRIIIECPIEDEKSECWSAYSIVSDIYRPNPNRLRDWISSPKSTGYESLHTTVLGIDNKWVEVQIRTKRMDEVAEKGHAAHWKYKEGANAVGSVSWLAKMREILENPQIDSFGEDNNSRMELYTDEIFIFTPQGDLRRLSANSTMLDFAYEIHGNLGNTCVGGKVNDKVVPIKHILQNGDKVEILTSKSQSPKQDWLSFVNTSKARGNIKKYLKDAEYKEAESGKEIILRKFAQNKIKYSDENVSKILKHLNYKTVLDLYVAASNNKIDFACLKDIYAEDGKPDTEKKPATINPVVFKERVHKNLQIQSDNLLIIDDSLDNIDYKLAKCCNPIKGDDIFGFISANGGIKIHRLNCPNAMHMLEKYPYRIIKTAWNTGKSNAEFSVGIRITGNDDLSIINNVNQLIGREAHISIRNMSLTSKDGNFEGFFALNIQDIQQLHKLLEKIKMIKGVHSAERFSN